MARSIWRRSFRYASTLLVLLTAGASEARATTGDTLRLQDVLALVVERSPVVRAAYAEADQAHARAWMTSEFWDPVLSLEAERSRTAAGGGSSSWGGAYRASVLQRTRWGVEVAPYVSHVVAGIPGSQAALATGGTAVGLSVTLPLTRVGPRHPLGLALSASRLSAAATDREREHTVATELLGVTLAYWDLRGAQERLSVAQDAAERSAEVRSIIARLVAAGERAAADEAQAAAFVADRLTEVAIARQALWERASSLGTACGLPAARFVDVAFDREMPGLALQRDPSAAIEDRSDLAALRAAVRVQRIVGRQRAMEVLPDLTLSTAIAQALNEDLPGFATAPQLTLSLSLQGSLFRTRARAALAEQQARTRAQEFVLERAFIEAGNRAAAANAAVDNAVRELTAAEQALEAHRKAVENERRRLAASFATVFDVILAEDRLTSARLAVTAARVRLGQSIARFAFESGALSAKGELSMEDASARLLGHSRGGMP